jgi:hypothetical protein
MDQNINRPWFNLIICPDCNNQQIQAFALPRELVLLQRLKTIGLLISLLACTALLAQTVTVEGRIINDKGLPLQNAVIKVDGVKTIAYSDVSGLFRLNLEPNAIYTLRVTFSGHIPYRTDFALADSSLNLGDIFLSEKTFGVIDVTYIKTPEGFDGFPPVQMNRLASPTGNFEDLIKAVGLGVSSNNELSSNYNVRGGNYDENEIYVNGIQIYRPFIVRAGQQEGLSFIHGEFVEQIFFSSGGFDARYGDVLSSVLDVRYREPVQFGASVQISLMGAQAHVEGQYNGRRGNYILGARYRANSYLLNSLPTKGDYNPTFFDVQGVSNYYLDYNGANSYKKLFVLGHYSSNNFLFVPTSRTTEWGTVNEAYQLRVFFEGQEETSFNTFTVAGGYEWKASSQLQMNFGTSVFHSIESEHFDVLGEYWINELETDPSKEDFGDSTSNIGVGGFLDHGRNDLNVWIGNVFYDGSFTPNQKLNESGKKSKSLSMNWGVKSQFESFQDVLSEWHMIDSAGYSIPQGDPDQVELKDVIKQNNLVESYRFTGHYQFDQNFISKKDVPVSLRKKVRTDSSKYEISFIDTISDSPAKLSISFGVRGGYRTYNEEGWITPRFALTYNPRAYFIDQDTNLFRRNIKLRASSGLYYQPPLYRTMRYLDGTVNPEVVSQKSWHNVLSADIYFRMWNRPFKFITEVYYKYMWDVVPYEIDNVRIRYYAENNAVAYATGIDAKINGEFVKGVESFFRVGILKTMEEIEGDDYYIYLNSDGDTIVPGYTFNDIATDSIHQEPGWIPRPTDQLVTFTLFFQDKMPKYENFKVSANLNFGTPLPYGPPSYERYKDVLRTKAYMRLDLGFMFDFVNETTKIEKPSSKFQKSFEQFTISVDAFNLLGIQNVVSYQWLQDIAGRYYSIPNHLTGRRINLRLIIVI